VQGFHRQGLPPQAAARRRAAAVQACDPAQRPASQLAQRDHCLRQPAAQKTERASRLFHLQCYLANRQGLRWCSTLCAAAWPPRHCATTARRCNALGAYGKGSQYLATHATLSAANSKPTALKQDLGQCNSECRTSKRDPWDLAHSAKRLYSLQQTRCTIGPFQIKRICGAVQGADLDAASLVESFPHTAHLSGAQLHNSTKVPGVTQAWRSLHRAPRCTASQRTARP